MASFHVSYRLKEIKRNAFLSASNSNLYLSGWSSSLLLISGFLKIESSKRYTLSFEGLPTNNFSGQGPVPTWFQIDSLFNFEILSTPAFIAFSEEGKNLLKE